MAAAGANVADYRVYFLDAAGHIVGARVITCASDAEAIAVASKDLEGHPALEVWQGARQVAAIKAASVSGRPPKVTQFP